MYHELDDNETVCKHCGKHHSEWSDHPNLRECPAFQKDDPFSLKAVEVLEDDMRSYIAWDADPVTAFDQEAWEKQNANIVRGDN